MPMQPSPMADTVNPLLPNCRCFMNPPLFDDDVYIARESEFAPQHGSVDPPSVRRDRCSSLTSFTIVITYDTLVVSASDGSDTSRVHRVRWQESVSRVPRFVDGSGQGADPSASVSVRTGQPRRSQERRGRRLGSSR